MPAEDSPPREYERELIEFWRRFSDERFAASFIGVGPDTVLSFAGWLARERGQVLRAAPGGLVPGWQPWDLKVSVTLLPEVTGPRRSPELDPWVWRPHHYLGWQSEHGPVVVDCGVALIDRDALNPGDTGSAWVRFFNPVWVLALDIAVGSRLDLREGGRTPVARAEVLQVM